VRRGGREGVIVNASSSRMRSGCYGEEGGMRLDYRMGTGMVYAAWVYSGSGIRNRDING